MDLCKVIYENVEKKIISQQTYQYIIYMGHRHFEVL